MIIDRPTPTARIQEAFSVHPAVALTGPRQCGKTTLARLIAAGAGQVAYFDLERAADRRRLAAPEVSLGGLDGLVVIDEIQHSPTLFETVRVLVDRPGNTTRFLLPGSASPTLVKGAAETLAGRVGLVDLAGFDLGEVDPGAWRALWLRGGFPRSYLAREVRGSALWRRDFLRTFLERDLPRLGITIPSERLRRFWTMIAHYHGQVWNAAEFARSLGTSEGTARNYLDLLAGAFMVRALPPWFENVKKRQVKSPRLYLRDSGILHTLLGLPDAAALSGHPKVGASFEGFAIEQLLAAFDTQDAYFWATHGGAELDLFIRHHGRRYGFEFKFADAPGSTRSMRVALQDLRFDHLWIVYPGEERYDIDDTISVVPASECFALAESLRERS